MKVVANMTSRSALRTKTAMSEDVQPNVRRGTGRTTGVRKGCPMSGRYDLHPFCPDNNRTLSYLLILGTKAP